MSAGATNQITGRVIIDFRDGEVVAILPVADSEEQAAALLRQLEQAAAMGDLTQFRSDNDTR